MHKNNLNNGISMAVKISGIYSSLWAGCNKLRGVRHESQHRNHSESGNVLFLILIAVALFAALSYAVTRSSRTGGGNADKETNLVSSAELTQHPVSVKTSILRMIVSGTAVEDLEFNQPTDFGSCSSPEVCVFHPNGGGATYQSPTSTISENPAVSWIYSAVFEVDNIGSDSPGDFAGNEITAVLFDVKKNICESMHERLGIVSIPVINVAYFPIISNLIGGYMNHLFTPATERYILGAAGANGTDSLTGQIQGCFASNEATPKYFYYQVLVER